MIQICLYIGLNRAFCGTKKAVKLDECFSELTVVCLVTMMHRVNEAQITDG